MILWTCRTLLNCLSNARNALLSSATTFLSTPGRDLQALKVVLDGSISSAPDNVLITQHPIVAT